MDSIYFTDPLGLLIELASYRFEPPQGTTHADVLMIGPTSSGMASEKIAFVRATGLSRVGAAMSASSVVCWRPKAPSSRRFARRSRRWLRTFRRTSMPSSPGSNSRAR